MAQLTCSNGNVRSLVPKILHGKMEYTDSRLIFLMITLSGKSILSLDLQNVYFVRFYHIQTSILQEQSVFQFWTRKKTGSPTLQWNNCCLVFKSYWKMSQIFRALPSSSLWTCIKATERSISKKSAHSLINKKRNDRLLRSAI